MVASSMRRIAHGARHRPHLVERRGVGDDAVAADAAVGRLDADDAAVRGRLADRAAGIGAERAETLARGDRGGRAARRAARHALAVPGIARAAVGGVLVRRAHGELVAVELADAHRAGVEQAARDGGVVGRDEVLEDLATRRWCGRRA